MRRWQLVILSVITMFVVLTVGVMGIRGSGEIVLGINKNSLKLLEANVAPTSSAAPASSTTYLASNFCGNAPANGAISGGRDDNGDLLWYCVANHNDGSRQPGKWLPSDRTCHYSWGGKEYSTKSYAFVTQQSGQSTIINHVSQAPIRNSCKASLGVGKDSNGSPLGSCSSVVFDRNGNALSKHNQPGKWVVKTGSTPQPATCLVSYGGKEWQMGYNFGELPTDFYVLWDSPNCTPSNIGYSDLCN